MTYWTVFQGLRGKYSFFSCQNGTQLGQNNQLRRLSRTVPNLQLPSLPDHNESDFPAAQLLARTPNMETDLLLGGLRGRELGPQASARSAPSFGWVCGLELQISERSLTVSDTKVVILTMNSHTEEYVECLPTPTNIIWQMTERESLLYIRLKSSSLVQSTHSGFDLLCFLHFL